MQCPKCFGYDTTLVNNTHYVCNNKTCVDTSGHQTQFEVVNDEKIHFPLNEIFVGRTKNEFYRKRYLVINE